MKRTHPKYKSRKFRLRKNSQTRGKRVVIKKCVNIKNANAKAIMVENFIEMLNTVKLYHWNTHSFAQHKATDELYERLNDHVDKFVEVLMGKKEEHIYHVSKQLPLVNTHKLSNFKDQIYQYRDYLTGLNKCLDSTKDTDLLNIRDEILGDINQFLYLLTLDK